MFDPALSPQPPTFDAIKGESRRVSVTPIDLRQRRFRSRLNGFDKVEVAAFLVAVADDYEHTLREADHFRQELTKIEPILKEHREGEKTLRNTLLTAQRLSDEMKEQAEREGQRIVREAEDRAALLLAQTQLRLDEIQRDIDSLGLKRREIEATLEASIDTLRTTLECVRDRADRTADDLILDRPRQAADQPSGDVPPLDASRGRKAAVR
jgi:cell division initiation protein